MVLVSPFVDRSGYTLAKRRCLTKVPMRSRLLLPNEEVPGGSRDAGGTLKDQRLLLSVHAAMLGMKHDERDMTRIGYDRILTCTMICMHVIVCMHICIHVGQTIR